jgi:hypothetical protein
MVMQIKRRTSGGAGAPSGLINGQLAYNETDDTLYYGKGVGAGSPAAATSVVAIAGFGAFVSLSGAQNIAGVKTFTSPPVIPNAANANEPYAKGQVDTLLTAKAPLLSPTFTGTPFAPTAAAGTNTTQIATTAFVTSQMGIANGIATLGADSKILSSQLPASAVGGMAYQGTWNASTNTPTIPAAVAGNKGWYYKVATAGATNIDGITDWLPGDWIVSNGATWDKIDNTEAVSSVAGKTGAVVLAVADIGGLGTIATQAANAVNLTGGSLSAAVVHDDGTF